LCPLSVNQMNVFEWLETLDVSKESSDARPYEYDVDIRDCRDYTRWHTTVFSNLMFEDFITWLDWQCSSTVFKVKGIDSQQTW